MKCNVDLGILVSNLLSASMDSPESLWGMLLAFCLHFPHLVNRNKDDLPHRVVEVMNEKTLVIRAANKPREKCPVSFIKLLGLSMAMSR